MGKKSNHKHEYELVEIKEDGWFTHEKVCIICGHSYDKIRIDDFDNQLKELKKELFKPTGRNLFD